MFTNHAPSASAETAARDAVASPVSVSLDAVIPGVEDRPLHDALTIRLTEERLLQLFTEGKTFGTVHTCIGQEWIGVAIAAALETQDYVFSNHRGHGHYIARTGDVEGLIAEVMGRSSGVCGGRGGSQHLCRERFFSNGVQGGIVPVSAGLALAQRLTGDDGIAVVFIGDGTLGEGVVYETFNLAAKWRLPLLIVLEDNGVAQSTSQAETLAGTITGRADAFGIETLGADTWHPSELMTVADDAVHRVRRTRQPLMLHVKTYRLRAHSKGDDDRDPDEVAAFDRHDALSRIIDEGSPAVHRVIEAIDHRLERAVVQAEASPFTEVEECSLQFQSLDATGDRWREVSFEPKRIVEAIRDQLADAMERDERVIILGEDIRDPYGGAFKATAGLSDRFKDRVRNTPISEAAIVGMGCGLAMAGLRPVVELMFGDFLMLAADQIVNHAAKFAWMYNDQVQVPLIIRTPMGGYRGYGPTHSQSLEKHFLGIPGTRVLALHERYCPGLVYRTLLETNDRPTIVIENKLLYGRRTDPQPPTGYELRATNTPFPTLRLTPPEQPDVTIVAYGGMVAVAEAAMRALVDDEEIFCELVIPTQLYPLDLQPIAESVSRTGRLLVVEEGQGFGGFGSELIAQVVTRNGSPAIRTSRVHAAARPIPASKPAEHATLPTAENVIQAAIGLVTSRS